MNVFSNLPTALTEEVFETLADSPNVRIERIISREHSSPEGFWYDQDWAEWVLVLQGEAVLQFEGQEPLTMGPGDYVNIPAHARHRVEQTKVGEPTVWLAVHYNPA